MPGRGTPSGQECVPARCPACGHHAPVIYVHGHGQCARCGVNTEPCCQPDHTPQQQDPTDQGLGSLAPANGVPDGPLALRCSVLRHVPHGFSTRRGGVSGGVFATLNFGNPAELATDLRDPAAHIAENFRRLLTAAGAPGRGVVQAHQVHGAQVDVVTRASPRRPGPDPQADGLVTDDPGVMLAVRTADCLPVLLASGDGRIVGAAHAGWRGIVAGVIGATVDAMRSLGAREIVAALGPCIGAEAFEVGPEVADRFDRLFDPSTAVVLRRPAWARPHVDLRRAAFLQLAQAGAAGAQVLPNCTVSEPDLFFSHRRDGAQRGGTGRMASVVGPRSG